MCTNFTATRNKPWVKEHLKVDLPTAPYPPEAYPGYAAPLVANSHSTGQVAKHNVGKLHWPRLAMETICPSASEWID